jgi:hypothetical protein
MKEATLGYPLFDRNSAFGFDGVFDCRGFPGGLRPGVGVDDPASTPVSSRGAGLMGRARQILTRRSSIAGGGVQAD